MLSASRAFASCSPHEPIVELLSRLVAPTCPVSAVCVGGTFDQAHLKGAHKVEEHQLEIAAGKEAVLELEVAIPIGEPGGGKRFSSLLLRWGNEGAFVWTLDSRVRGDGELQVSTTVQFVRSKEHAQRQQPEDDAEVAEASSLGSTAASSELEDDEAMLTTPPTIERLVERDGGGAGAWDEEILLMRGSNRIKVEERS